ncbi:hypothetical protein OESDEN_04856 [Oesophagostomum dentatum]|uniref:7TM GPCR serpentine receptor class x (Srx) domain-containing protein n=1 Tax=Oesophagostomum dentatum TaxID=61180 RepID=A0A0B1TGJ5_OESDE|nr:hypothetical protein OESDEN_04856 [Oesophagostomum dentatum]
MTGMYRGRLLNIPCYKIMFLNGFVDVIELLITTYAIPYFHFTGAVFCSARTLDWIVGHFVYANWCGSTFNCFTLALNRIVEIIPAAKRFRFLFHGNAPFVWIFFSISLMVMTAFTTRPIPYNTKISAILNTPVISDDVEWVNILESA